MDTRSPGVARQNKACEGPKKPPQKKNPQEAEGKERHQLSLLPRADPELQDLWYGQEKGGDVDEDVLGRAGFAQRHVVDALALQQRVEPFLQRRALEGDGEEGGNVEEHEGGQEKPGDGAQPTGDVEEAEVEQEDGRLDADVGRNVQQVDGVVHLPQREKGRLELRGRSN